MSHCEILPNGDRVLVSDDLTDDEREALAQYIELLKSAAIRAEESAALTDEERVAEDERRRVGRERLERIQRRARGVR